MKVQPYIFGTLLAVSISLTACAGTGTAINDSAASNKTTDVKNVEKCKYFEFWKN